MRRGFTLVEVLAATTLSTAIAITGGVWMMTVQRSATAVRQQSAQATATMLVITRLREDLQQATASVSQDTDTPEFLMTGNAGSMQHWVRWRVTAGSAERATRPTSGGDWVCESITAGIDAIRYECDPQGRQRVRVTAGGSTIAVPIEAARSDVP